MRKNMEPRKTRKDAKTETPSSMVFRSRIEPRERPNRFEIFSFACPKGVSRLWRFLFTAVHR